MRSHADNEQEPKRHKDYGAKTVTSQGSHDNVRTSGREEHHCKLGKFPVQRRMRGRLRHTLPADPETTTGIVHAPIMQSGHYPGFKRGDAHVKT